ncbi:MAG: DegV family protein [Butyricicoccus sp.]|nr:DegV family protein [Butyricicoccus sp.]
MNDQKIALLTDSCADISPKLLKKYDIFMVPLQIKFSDGDYLDGVTINAKEIYKRLPTEMPKTSLPSGELIEQTFRKILDKGYEKVLCVNLSSGLSGTHNMVRLLGMEFVGLEVAAFDSVSGSMGQGMVVLQLAKYIEEGRSWSELLRATPRLIANTNVWFCIDTLEYLQKGGRIGKITAVAGSLLNIKPVLTFAPSGELINVSKARGRQLAMGKMASLLQEKYIEGTPYNLAFANGDCVAEMKAIREKVTALMPDARNVFEGEIDCTLASYVGPHLLGCAIQMLPDNLFDF